MGESTLKTAILISKRSLTKSEEPELSFQKHCCFFKGVEND